MQRNTLLGFAKIRVPAWHLTIADVAVHTKDGKRWAQLQPRRLSCCPARAICSCEAGPDLRPGTRGACSASVPACSARPGRQRSVRCAARHARRARASRRGSLRKRALVRIVSVADPAGYVFEQKKKDTAAPSNSLRRPLYDEGDDAELYVHASGKSCRLHHRANANSSRMCDVAGVQHDRGGDHLRRCRADRRRAGCWPSHRFDASYKGRERYQ
jgi:hypothetical protein